MAELNAYIRAGSAPSTPSGGTFDFSSQALTPPVGINVFAVKGVVPDASLEEVFRSIVPFFFPLTAVLVLVIILVIQ